MTPSDFQALLRDQVLIIDGALGTMTQELNLGPEVYGGEEFQMLADILVLSRPDDIKNIHLKYYRAGASAVETNTLCASPLKLQELDFSRLRPDCFPTLKDGKGIKELSIDDLSYQLNYRAVQIARRALTEYSRDPDYDGRPLMVFGSLGPSNWVLSSTQANLSRGEFDQIERNFYLQALGLIDGGVDVLLFETQQDALELKAAIFGAKRALSERGKQLPIIAQVTVDSFAKMQLFNTSIEAVLTTLQDIGIHAFGINCGLGPDQMLPAVRKMSRYSKIPISVIPNAGLPHAEFGRTVFKLSPEEMTRHMKVFVEEYGVNIIGGCCGTTPDHIRHLSKTLKGTTPGNREIERGVFVSGPQQSVKLDSENSLLRIGERLNVRGSKKVREAVEKSTPINQEALEEVVREQVRDLGLNLIDVCMDSNTVETAATLVSVIQSQTMDFPAVMSLDSFDVEALKQAIKVYPGRPIINSISLEEFSPGVDKIDAVLEVTHKHAPVYIALTTGPEGPAVTSEEKVALARQIIEKVTSTYPVKAEQLFIDINAFPIGSESEENLNFAVESIQSIERIKAIHPDVKTIIGVGNLTNGLASKPYMRKVLTSVFLDEARKKGLDAAIINPNHYVPVDSLPPDDYQRGKEIVLNHDMEAFAELEEIAIRQKGVAISKKTNYDDLDPYESVRFKIKDGFKERTKGSLRMGTQQYEYQDKIVSHVANIVKEISPLDLINKHLMPTMEELGAGFADGTISLPHLLKSADVMKQVMMFLEAYIKATSSSDTNQESISKGTVVIGTVYQDVHSIGKDLSKTLIENYGYNVVDLGVQVPLQKFVEAAKEHQAIAIGLSALLVQTSNHMITLSSMLREEGMENTPLLIGGAPVNSRHAAFVAMAGVEDESSIRDNVFFCRSGMDGVTYLNQLASADQREALLSSNKQKLIRGFKSGTRQIIKQESLLSTLPRRKIRFDKRDIRQTEPIPLQKIDYSMRRFLPFINKRQLFSLNWKFGGQKNWEKKGVTEAELNRLLDTWIDKIEQNDWVRPQALFAVYPCVSDGQRVTVLTPDGDKTLGILTFNDIIGADNADIFSVAQYFNPKEIDRIGLSIATSGSAVLAPLQEFSKNDQESSLLLQGLANRVAEDLAERVNQTIEELVYGTVTGSSHRYSPGYPAMNRIENNRVIMDILNGSEELDIELTEMNEFIPTSSTGAIICFHPDAGYR